MPGGVRSRCESPRSTRSRRISFRLRAALAGLDERDRELLALRYGGDLTARQIGALLGLRTNAVEVALHRALGRLRTVLETGPAGDRSPALEQRAAAARAPTRST